MNARLVSQLSEAVDELADAFLDFASGMIQINSVNPPGNYDEIAAYVDRRLRAFGFEAQIVAVPRERSEALGYALQRKNVIATLPGSVGRPRLALVPHLDTVPIEDPSAWKYPIFGGVIDAGRIWGRGACDSKGRLACFALAMAAIRHAGIPLKGTLVLAATADGEVGGALGAGYLVEAGHLDVDWAIMEGFINVLYRGYGGSLTFQLDVAGTPAHTSTPWLGVNAIEKASHAIAALEEFQEELRQEPSAVPEYRYSTLNVGRIHGGVKESVVPERCEIECYMNLMPGHATEDILKRIREKLDGLAAHDPDFRYDLTVSHTQEPFVSAADAPVVVAVQKALQTVRGETLRPKIGRGGSDARHLIPRGIPAVTFGPGLRPDSAYHSSDEHLEINDFVDAAIVVALAAVELLGVAHGEKAKIWK